MYKKTHQLFLSISLCSVTVQMCKLYYDDFGKLNLWVMISLEPTQPGKIQICQRGNLLTIYLHKVIKNFKF